MLDLATQNWHLAQAIGALVIETVSYLAIEQKKIYMNNVYFPDRLTLRLAPDL